MEGNWKHTVKLNDISCSYRSWQLKDIPCGHAIVAIHHKKLKPTDYITH